MFLTVLHCNLACHDRWAVLDRDIMLLSTTPSPRLPPHSPPPYQHSRVRVRKETHPLPDPDVHGGHPELPAGLLPRQMLQGPAEDRHRPVIDTPAHPLGPPPQWPPGVSGMAQNLTFTTVIVINVDVVYSQFNMIGGNKLFLMPCPDPASYCIDLSKDPPSLSPLDLNRR